MKEQVGLPHIVYKAALLAGLLALSLGRADKVSAQEGSTSLTTPTPLSSGILEAVPTPMPPLGQELLGYLNEGAGYLENYLEGPAESGQQNMAFSHDPVRTLEHGFRSAGKAAGWALAGIAGLVGVGGVLALASSRPSEDFGSGAGGQSEPSPANDGAPSGGSSLGQKVAEAATEDPNYLNHDAVDYMAAQDVLQRARKAKVKEVQGGFLRNPSVVVELAYVLGRQAKAAHDFREEKKKYEQKPGSQKSVMGYVEATLNLTRAQENTRNTIKQVDATTLGLANARVPQPEKVMDNMTPEELSAVGSRYERTLADV
jgi:hypothetical protein